MKDAMTIYRMQHQSLCALPFYAYAFTCYAAHSRCDADTCAEEMGILIAVKTGAMLLIF